MSNAEIISTGTVPLNSVRRILEPVMVLPTTSICSSIGFDASWKNCSSLALRSSSLQLAEIRQGIGRIAMTSLWMNSASSAVPFNNSFSSCLGSNSPLKPFSNTTSKSLSALKIIDTSAWRAKLNKASDNCFSLISKSMGAATQLPLVAADIANAQQEAKRLPCFNRECFLTM